MLCDLLGCGYGKYIVPNQHVIYLDAKWNLKWQECEVKIGLVNVNVDVREGLQSILTKIVECNVGNISVF